MFLASPAAVNEEIRRDQIITDQSSPVFNLSPNPLLGQQRQRPFESATNFNVQVMFLIFIF
jgi:hypothetical protein